MALNGTKTHPLKPASIDGLRRLARCPLRGWELNPGVRDRLFRGDATNGPYAYQDADGDWRITDAGRAALAALAEGDTHGSVRALPLPGDKGEG